jgi:hypothetical protein
MACLRIYTYYTNTIEILEVSHDHSDISVTLPMYSCSTARRSMPNMLHNFNISTVTPTFLSLNTLRIIIGYSITYIENKHLLFLLVVKTFIFNVEWVNFPLISIPFRQCLIPP